MKRLIAFCFIAMCLQACKPELPEIPADVMPMEQMKVILADIHMADALAETKAQGGGNERDLSQQYLVQILKNRKVSMQEFKHSYDYYQSLPVLNNLLYEEVLTELSTRNAHVSK